MVFDFAKQDQGFKTPQQEVWARTVERRLQRRDVPRTRKQRAADRRDLSDGVAGPLRIGCVDWRGW